MAQVMECFVRPRARTHRNVKVVVIDVGAIGVDGEEACGEATDVPALAAYLKLGGALGLSVRAIRDGRVLISPEDTAALEAAKIAGIDTVMFAMNAGERSAARRECGASIRECISVSEAVRREDSRSVITEVFRFARPLDDREVDMVRAVYQRWYDEAGIEGHIAARELGSADLVAVERPYRPFEHDLHCPGSRELYLLTRALSEQIAPLTSWNGRKAPP